MGRLVEQVQNLARGYQLKGAKGNRKQQVGRMIRFAEFCENEGAAEIGQVGNRHVVRYWIEHEHLSKATRYHHFLAIRTLWQLAGKRGLPAEPIAPSSTMPVHESLTTAKPNRAVDAALAVSREAP